MLGIERIEEISSSDIKTVLVVDDVVVTAGRDGKVRIDDEGFESRREVVVGRGYINSLAVGGGFLFVGSQDGSISMYSAELCSSRGSRDEEVSKPVGVLCGHTSNVCSLDVFGSLVISSSWDATVKVWDVSLWENPGDGMVLSVGHPAAVWSARFVKEDVFVTGCADKLIRLYEDGRLTNTVFYHTSCIRSIVTVGNSIVSVDNEGIVIKTSLDGKLQRHYSTRDFMYSLSVCGEDSKTTRIICSGENGRVIVFNSDLRPISSVVVPVTSCWKTVGKGDKVYVGGSDGRLYVYSTSGNEDASRRLEEIRSSQAGPLKDGEFVSGGQKFKVMDGNVYQEVEGEWTFLGKGEGVKPPDNTFQVEVDSKYYTLSFDNNENVYEVAERFLRKNKLNEEFKEEIVDFIKKNFVPSSEFRISRTINVEGVKSVLRRMSGGDEDGGDGDGTDSYPYVVKNLEKPMVRDNENVEKELKRMLVNGPVFVALDLFRYFIVHKYDFDLSFMFAFVPRDRKEVITFVRLIASLFVDPPFNLDIFHSYVLELRDRGAVEGEVLDDYFTNRSLRNRM